MHKSDHIPITHAMTGRGRGRPRAFDRGAALGAATRLFWLKGYEATSMSELTQAMGIGSPSLYAAFGSKEGLYTEALRYYVSNFEGLVWTKFQNAATAREAVEGYLMDSAAALTGTLVDNPRGCMVALSSVGSEGYPELGELIRAERGSAFKRLKARLEQAVSGGEIPVETDVEALARFVQTVQYGMSILARDGAACAELAATAKIAMLGWDACTSAGRRP